MRTEPTKRRTLACAAVSFALAWIAPAVIAPVASAAPDPSDALRTAAEDRQGHGPSYWGPVPAPADSVTAALRQRPRAAWTWPGHVTYTAVGFPFHVMKLGFEQAVIHGQRAKGLSSLFPPYGPRKIMVTGSTDGSEYSVGASLHSDGDAGYYRAAVDWSTEHSSRAAIGWADPARRFAAGARYSNRAETRFHGIGPETTEHGETRFTQELAWVGASCRQPLVAGLDATASGVYSEVGARGSGEPDEHPSILDRHPRPVGYRDRTKGITLGLGLRHDTTVETAHPERGGVERFDAKRFLETGANGTDFWSFRGDVQRFLPMPYSKRALALRTYCAWIVADDLAAVPFQRLLTNDEPDQFRGYHDYRWRDRGIAGATVEYRWPFWAYGREDGAGADLVLFTDVGQVFRSFDEIRADNLTESYGVGLRFVSGRSYAGRLEFAWCEEGWKLRLKGDQLLQFAKGGLEHGRDSVALR